MFLFGDVENERKTTDNMLKSIAPNIAVLNTNNLHILGAPLCADGINSVLSDKIKTFEKLCNRVWNIDAHDAFFLLKNCLAIPKLTYTLRTSLSYGRGLLDMFDTILKDNLSTILNIKYDDTSWKQEYTTVISSCLLGFSYVLF
jgi:hypothetical protein